MPERTAQEIASAQLNYDVAEAKIALDRLLHGTSAGSTVIDAIENLIGKVVMRWWFARIVKNKAAHLMVDAGEIEGRRRVRALKLASIQQIINGKAYKGQPPDATSLQMVALDQQVANTAIWQALIDAAIISPDGKQQYLDDALDELERRTVNYASQLDLPGGRITKN